MDRQCLHRLGRRLTELSRQADLRSDDVLPSPAESLLLEDVVMYPDSTIGDIVRRTGFTQGYVSKCVAAMVERGWTTAATDAGDRRRTRVSLSRGLSTAVAERTPPVPDLLVRALGDPARAKRVMRLLDELAELVLD